VARGPLARKVDHGAKPPLEKPIHQSTLKDDSDVERKIGDRRLDHVVRLTLSLSCGHHRSLESINSRLGALRWGFPTENPEEGYECQRSTIFLIPPRSHDPELLSSSLFLLYFRSSLFSLFFSRFFSLLLIRSSDFTFILSPSSDTCTGTAGVFAGPWFRHAGRRKNDSPMPVRKPRHRPRWRRRAQGVIRFESLPSPKCGAMAQR